MHETTITLPPAGSTDDRGVPRDLHGAGRLVLALGALGIVYGDIGTSPLYAIQTVFSIDHHAVRATPSDVYGIVSFVFWSITLIVSLKYVTVVMRADNDGEGGVLALTALASRISRKKSARAGGLVILGLLGACLFYGDSIITPAISVLSSIEGLEVPYPSLTHLVVPLAAVVLALLFLLQSRGTHRVGVLFGPAMVAWFLLVAAGGVRGIVMRPDVVAGLSPSYAVAFMADRPGVAFVAVGAVVLTITGAEALYADMGHFGPAPIRIAWFGLVFPALTLNYLGQAGLILAHPSARVNPFFILLPHWFQLPAVIVATVATVIASQAVISGSYSMTRQAVQLGFLPAMTVRHTSESEAGQVYMPAVNWALFVGVMVLVFTFRNSSNLANAYGIAVTGTFVTTTCLLLYVARSSWKWRPWRLALIVVFFGLLELLFFSGNIDKVVNGGWLPLGVGLCLFGIMTTWRRGRQLVVERRYEREGPLAAFVEEIHRSGLPRVAGTGVFPHPNRATTPLALRANVDHNRVLHRQVVILSAAPRAVAHVRPDQRLEYDDLGYADDGIAHVTLHYGFFDTPDIPAALAGDPTLGGRVAAIDPAGVSYFVSRASLARDKAAGRRNAGMRSWRKRLFITLAHNAADPAETFRLPAEQTVVMGSRVQI